MRLFAALEIPAAVRAEIEERSREIRSQLAPARWVPTENLHLTLVFLGEVEEGALPALRRELSPAFTASPPFELALREGGTFPPRRPARVAWVGVTGDAEVHRLQARVEAAAVRAVGLEAEGRPYHPHLTLARPRQPWGRRDIEVFERGFAGELGGPFRVAEGALFESRLGAGGARYRRLEAWPLAGAEGGGR